MERLENQIDWYDQRSSSNQRWFKLFNTMEIAAAGGIAFLSGMGFHAALGGMVALALVVIKGIQAQNQFYHNWVVYRSTCEALKHEKFLWLAQAGPYADISQPDKALAERIESLISTEHAKWVAGRDRVKKDPDGQAREVSAVT